ncbi:hypothetical protein SASPL_121404 [Salvia splendens]|uniref:Transmembrane protein n=1 Tax=Salvia splendens TaxID=180675 RepID=A0A8X8XRF4_SALSN|nr:hypothetical protein SASPL_121404 [Salvia splendens]
MFSNSTHVNTVPLYLNSVPSNAPPSYVYAQPSVVNQVGPPELSPAARLLARTYENQALVFRDEQGQERVYCSICCEYGSGSSSRGYGYHSPDGSRNITPLEPAVTAPEPVFGATSEQGSVTAVTVEVSLLQQLVTLMEKVDTCMEKVVTSVNFLQQFFQSVYQVDYLTLRHGFITAHFSEGNSFDFQKYIERALEKDFEVAVGMRLWIWVFSVLFIFFNAYVFHNYVWLPFIPLVMLLIVGTKLQGIITKMCLDTSDKSHVIQGTLLVRPGDHFFWFDRPRFLLHLMHLLLFQIMNGSSSFAELVSTGILRMVLGEYQTSDPLSVFRV